MSSTDVENPQVEGPRILCHRFEPPPDRAELGPAWREHLAPIFAVSFRSETDLTIPIARLVATRMADHPGPVRVSYLARAFRPPAPGRPAPAEQRQAGVELLGDGGPGADAEVLARLVPDLDLDLDLDLPDDALTEAPAAPGAFAASIAPPLAPAGEPAPADEPLAFDPEPTAPTPMAPIAPEQAPQAPALDFPDSLSLEDSMRADLEPGPAPASAPVPLEFDLGDLSLDLDADTARPATGTGTGMAAATEPPASSFGADAGLAEDAPDSLELPDDPLATKLALAEEFNAIGDAEGARTLVEEVIAESSGPLKARAQRLLADLG